MDFELAYYVVQVAYDYAKKMDDKAYWLEVKWAIDKIKNADNWGNLCDAQALGFDCP